MDKENGAWKYVTGRTGLADLNPGGILLLEFCACLQQVPRRWSMIDEAFKSLELCPSVLGTLVKSRAVKGSLPVGELDQPEGEETKVTLPAKVCREDHLVNASVVWSQSSALPGLKGAA